MTRVLLAKIPVTDGKMTLVYDNYVFHYVVDSGICYMCMSDVTDRHRVPYSFLRDMREAFVNRYGFEAPLTAIAFSFNEEFSRFIQNRMEYYNGGGSADNIDHVKSQIEDVKGVMVQNIEKVLERGEKIELLVDKTDRLNQQAFKFESSSRNLRRHLYWRKVRCIAFATVAATLLVFFIVASFCGGLDFHKCRLNH